MIKRFPNFITGFGVYKVIHLWILKLYQNFTETNSGINSE